MALATTTIQSAPVIQERPHRLSIETAGFMILLLGAWSGIISYVGPLFGYSGDGSNAWTWNVSHGLLFLAPGAAAFLVGGLVMIEGVSRGLGRSAMLAIAGLLGVACGAWLVIGPIAWPVLEGSTFFHTAPALQSFDFRIGYSIGTGALLVAFSAFVLGESRSSRVVGGVAQVPATYPVSPAEPVTNEYV